MGDGPVTPNLVLGLGTDRIANKEPVTPGTAVLHKGIGDPKIGLVRLEGAWIHGDGYIESAAAEGSSCTITNTAARVEVTFSTADGASTRVAVNEDGPPLERFGQPGEAVGEPVHRVAVAADEARLCAVGREGDAVAVPLALERPRVVGQFGHLGGRGDHGQRGSVGARGAVGPVGGTRTCLAVGTIGVAGAARTLVIVRV